MTAGGLHALIAAELAKPTPAEAVAAADAILSRHGHAVAVILFYGSCRRDADGSGLLDIYVLYDDAAAFHGRAWPALLTALLPPHVSLLKVSTGGRAAAAKVAALSCRQFRRRMDPASFDTTIWARFCQPATLLYARDAGLRRWTIETLSLGVRTAACWALRLAPPDAGPAVCWQRLFARTYRAELRPEGRGRPLLVYQAHAAWFDRALSLVKADGQAAGRMPSRTGRRGWELAWLVRSVWGKPLNLVRLLKAAGTFDAGTDYVLWKIGRHAGVRIVPTEWQRRHPVLAAPVLLWRLRFRR